MTLGLYRANGMNRGALMPLSVPLFRVFSRGYCSILCFFALPFCGLLLFFSFRWYRGTAVLLASNI